MLLRQERGSVLAIPQPSHAWMAGQMARAWGNQAFDRPAPFEDFCLGVEQHDIGWLDHDRVPRLDPSTGMAREFWHVPATEHTALWSEGVRRARVLGRFPALLVSLHGLTIYDLTFDEANASPENAAAVERFRTEQRAVQRVLMESLMADDGAEAISAETIERHRLLLLALDTLSLHVCWGVTEPISIHEVPALGGARRDLTLRLAPDRSDSLTLEPWPFGTAPLTLKAEGRRLHGPFADEDALASAWDAAPPCIINATLRPAAP